MSNYVFIVNGRKMKIKASGETDAWEQLKDKLGFEGDVDDFTDSLQDSDDYDVIFENPDDPLDYGNQINYSSNKQDCEYMGGIWVQGYRKRDGTYTREYCRKRQRIF